MKRTFPRGLIFLFFIPAASASGYPPGDTSVFNLVQQFDALAARPLWPGFEPGKTHSRFSMVRTRICLGILRRPQSLRQ
jgi:hypothetical protein